MEGRPDCVLAAPPRSPVSEPEGLRRAVENVDIEL